MDPIDSKTMGAPVESQEKDVRVAATGALWQAAVGMFAVSVPLIAVARIPSLPLFVLSAVVAGTICMWGFGKSGTRKSGRAKTASKREHQLEERIRELEERLANVETISQFEMQRVAQMEISPAGRERGEKSG